MRPLSSGSRSASSAARGKLRQLVEEQHAAVRQRDLAWPRRRTAAHQRRRAGGVVRRAHRPLAASVRTSKPRAPSPCSAALASASSSAIGGSRPGRRCASIDLPLPGGPTISRLWPPAAAISSARLAPTGLCTSRRSGPLRRGRRVAAGRAIGSGAARRPASARAPRRAGGRAARTSSPRASAASRALAAGSTSARCGACARNASASASAPRTGRSSPASDSSPANSWRARRCSVELPVGGQDAERDRQVEAAGLLGQVGRRQVDRDALVVREREAAVGQRGAHTLARLLDLGVGQTDQREARQAVGQVHFDLHGGRVQAIERAAGTSANDIAAVLPGRILPAGCSTGPASHRRSADRALDSPHWCRLTGLERPSGCADLARSGLASVARKLQKRSGLFHRPTRRQDTCS